MWLHTSGNYWNILIIINSNGFILQHKCKDVGVNIEDKCKDVGVNIENEELVKNVSSHIEKERDYFILFNCAD